MGDKFITKSEKLIKYIYLINFFAVVIKFVTPKALYLTSQIIINMRNDCT
jgi:hypothetical protein